MSSQLSSILNTSRSIYDRNRLFFTFFFVLGLFLIIDFIFFNYVPDHHFSSMDQVFNSAKKSSLTFAQDIWLGVLALVLGTLIIVISIASQSTPKLIDLYIDDEISLIYVWFITLGSIQALILQPYTLNDEALQQSAVFLNSYVLLPISYIMSLPYILYILRYTKTSNVITNIYRNSLRLLDRISGPDSNIALDSARSVGSYQYRFFESLNQMDDLLEYVNFKEPKGDIIHKISLIVQYFISVKGNISKKFFKIHERIRNDISFKTMVQQFSDMEVHQTFFEHKAYRLLGNAYIRLIERGDFDLASLCAAEVAACGKKAIEYDDENVIDVTIVRFNTFLRFGIKHGLRNNEPRNLYNAAFHYSDFIASLVRKEKIEHMKTACGYLKMYGHEIYRHSLSVPSFTFLVDVFTLELKKTVILLDETNHSDELMKEILKLFLEMDHTAEEATKDYINVAKIKNSGVRVLQIALALYFIKRNKLELADFIIKDITKDKDTVGHDLLRDAVNGNCFRIKVSGDTFWEDTDRGNTNLYYSPEKLFLPQFQERFEAFMQDKEIPKPVE